jgi:hypothetical protein
MSAATENVPLTTPRDFTMAMIDEIAKAHGLTLREVLGTCRDQKHVRARREAIVAVLKARPHLSYPQIGRIFRKDHTTVMHHLEKAGAHNSRSDWWKNKRGNANASIDNVGQSAGAATPAGVPSQANVVGRDGEIPVGQAGA